MAANILKVSQIGSKLPKLHGQKRWFSSVLAAVDAQNKTTLNVPPTHVTTLDSGIRVASEDWGSQTATVGIWFESGSRYEDDRTNGVAHFMEHMAFKGTTKRSQTQLELEIENMGAQLNAYTSREQTVFYSKCLAKDVPKALEILADIVQDAKLGEQEVERERSVILREMQEVESNLQEVVFDNLHAMAYQGTPLANTILGPTANIKSITAQDLRTYMTDHYKPARMVIAAAGGVKHTELVKLTEQVFNKLSNDYNGAIPSFKLPNCRYTGSDMRHRDDAMQLLHFAFAMEGTGWSDPDTLCLMVASTLLGAWDRTQPSSKQNAGRLARKCFEDELCHSYQSFNTCYTDTGLWGIYCICDPIKASHVIAAIQKEVGKFCTGLSRAEVERGKQLLIANTLLQLDSSTAVCEDIGRQMICHGRRVPVHELVHRIQRITPEYFREVCDNHLYDRCPVIAAVGPTEALTDYNNIRTATRNFLR